MRCEQIATNKERPTVAYAKSGAKDGFDLADANHDRKLSREDQ